MSNSVVVIPRVKHPPFTAWTTRVSNPVRSPRFRSSASVTAQRPGLDMFPTAPEMGPPFGAGSQVVHGRRQLVS